MTKPALLVFLGLNLLLIALPFGCTEAQDGAMPPPKTLGGVKEGAPLGPVASDPGILQDPSAYQPAKVEGKLGTPGATAAASGGADTGATADEQIRSVVMFLSNAIHDGFPDLALKAFNDQHVAPLKEQIDVVFATFTTFYDALYPELEMVFSSDTAGELEGVLLGTDNEEPEWTILSGESASVTPNVAAILFGPAKSTPSLTVMQQDGEWQFQLDAPLTAEETQQIVQYHEKLQEQLNRIVDYLYAVDNPDEQVVRTAIEQARAGETVELPEADADAPENADGADTPDDAEAGG